MDIGKLFLRLMVGAVFMGHGLQKLKGWFGGGGIAGAERMMEHNRVYPTRPNAYLNALTETLGGVAIATGAATPAATAGLTAVMVTAIRKVHWRNGFFNASGGWEFNGVLVAALAALTADGPGRWSVDGVVGRRRWGIGTALIALAVGAAASAAAIELGARNAPPLED